MRLPFGVIRPRGRGDRLDGAGADVEWSTLVACTRTLGDVDVTLVRARVDDGIVDAEVLYRVGAQEWRQPFVARLRDEEELTRQLQDAGFVWERWLDREAGWFLGSG